MPCTFKTALIVSMKCNSTPVCSSKEFCQGIYYSFIISEAPEAGGQDGHLPNQNGTYACNSLFFGPNYFI